MKYTYELTPDEFKALMKTVRYATDTIATALMLRAEQRAPLTPKRPPSASEVADPGDAADDCDDTPSVEPSPAPKPTADVLPFTVVKNEPAPPPVVSAPPMDEVSKAKAEERRVKALHGKDMWITLIDIWRTNFDTSGEQPDRVRNLNAALTPDTMAYLTSKAGLTDATREAIYLLDGGDPEAPPSLTNAQIREARLIAENIAQVASFHAPFVAERLEYTYEYHTLPSED